MKKRRNLNYFKSNADLYLMLIPAALFYLIFKYGPMYGVVMAFQDYNIFEGVFKSEWVGLEVFKEVLSQRTFWNVLFNTLRLNFLGLAIGFPAPILFALLLNEITRTRFKRVVQTISYMPHFISWVIIYGMILAFVSDDTGLLNVLLKSLGREKISFLLDRSWWHIFYIGSGVWKEVGWGAILYISAISTIDPELYQAASIDGAGRLRCMWHVTLPGIRSTIVMLLIFDIGTIISIGFDRPYLLGNTMVNDVSNVLSTYIYNNGLVRAQYSFTAAVGLFQSVVNFVLLMAADAIAKAFGEDGLFGGRQDAK